MEEKTILLIEDNQSDVALTLRALEKSDILNRVIVTRDGVEALAYLDSCAQPKNGERNKMPVLTLLDLKLPRVDGLEVLKRIRENKFTRRLPVVVLTSSREEKDILASYDLGANSYIRKPVDFEQFMYAVRQLGLYWLVLNEPSPNPAQQEC